MAEAGVKHKAVGQNIFFFVKKVVSQINYSALHEDMKDWM
jgi:hypothetical protein